MENQRSQGDEDNAMNASPIEQVRLTVPTTDNPMLPTLTFRTWVVGTIFCALLSFMTKFFFYRRYPINLSSRCFQLLLLLIGKLMAKTLPSSVMKFPGTRWKFSMNPGPFDVKEHVLLTILVTSGLDPGFGTFIIDMTKIFYHINWNFWAALIMTLAVQMLGYGFAGIFMKFLVYNSYMWFPVTLADVSVYRALHEGEQRPKGGTSRLQFFFIAIVASFAYAVIPSYYFSSLAALSLICLFWKNSIFAQQIGSGLHGYGIASFSFDWNAITAYLDNPLIYPISNIINKTIGFLMLLYVIASIAYWTNWNNAKKFPFLSYQIFDDSGQEYNVSKVLNEHDLTFNQEGYRSYSNLNLSVVHLLILGFGFACMTASVAHFILFHGRETWQQFKQANDSSNKTGDIHNTLMKKYNPVPQWWFLAIIVLSITLSIFCCEKFGKHLQLPYWGILLACLLSIIFILPFGVLAATTGEILNISMLSDMLIGYFYPGKPVASMVFKAYSFFTGYQALQFISHFKLAHYMKIPPKSMFAAQVTGAIISSVVNLVTTWRLISTVKNICDPDKLPKGSPWTCPGIQASFSVTVIWGVVGPKHVFFPDGKYSKIYYFFLIGLVAPLLVWVLSKCYPERKWIKSINIPVIFGGLNALSFGGAVNYWSWISIGLLYNFIVYKRYKDWWAKYNYLLAYGLDLGIAIYALLASFTLQVNGIYGVDWWGFDAGDHCALAQCPTVSGISVDGCPTV